ncbi:MAG: ribonuclease III [Acidimicrobiales bacterium]
MAPELLHQALSHRSYCAETPGQDSNERLEWLGDAVLGLAVTHHLYELFPGVPEGDLARIRAAVVSTGALAPIAEHLGVGSAIGLGRGEEASGGRHKDSILADALEAIIGAVYLSAGHVGASELVLELVGERIDAVAAEARLGDPKNRLQELSSHLGLGQPVYRLNERGPDHAKAFTAEVCVGAERLGSGDGRSKKQAERAAAAEAVAVLLAMPSPPMPEPRSL